MDNNELTICSVSFNSRPHLDINSRLAGSLNSTSPRWIVIENSNAGSDSAVDIGSDRFDVHPGFDYDPDKSRPASFHHGLGLNKALGMVKTRFALVLDPDFYIIRKNWIDEALEYMNSNGLAFLGVPWHPRHTSKYRYFPCAHCLFIDLGKVSSGQIDMLPGNEAIVARKRKRFFPEGSLFARGCSFLFGRGRFGRSRDTGQLLFDKFYGDVSARAECLTPVYKISKKVRRLTKAFLYLEKLLPDRLRYVPGRRGYYSEIGFAEFGLPDLNALGWEEFLWRGEPFGFHLRGQANGNMNKQEELMLLMQYINEIVDCGCIEAEAE